MTIVSVDPFVDAECMLKEASCRKCEASDVFSIADYVSLNIPATKENTKCVNFETLMKLKKGACVVNTARAEIIDEDGLAKALAERADLKYATDVEPKNKEIFAGKFAERYYCTPKKMGAQTEEANENAGVAAAHQIVGFFERKDVKFQVNK
jgi:D-3-phosphoglycerate dehydrogenase